MSESSQLSAIGFPLAASPDWQSLVRYFELGEGFAFIVLLVSDIVVAEVCRQELTNLLRERGKTLEVISIEKSADLDRFTETLFNVPVSEELGAVWVGNVDTASRRNPGLAIAWQGAVARLNQFRNSLRERFHVPVIFVGEPWLQQLIRENAPDLWSVKTLVASVEAQHDTPLFGAGVRPVMLDGSQVVTGPDPELAMAEAARMLQLGKKLSAARLLHRAALGYSSQGEWARAADQLKKSLAIGAEAGGGEDEQAEKLLDLGTS